MVLFVSAAAHEDVPHMVEDIRLMRGVVTRLDQFRRMKERQWKAVASAPTAPKEKTE